MAARLKCVPIPHSPWPPSGSALLDEIVARRKQIMARMRAGAYVAPPLLLPPISPPLPPPTDDKDSVVLFVPLPGKWSKIPSIQLMVVSYFNIGSQYPVRVIDLKSSIRLVRFVRPRQVAMYLAKIFTDYSLPEIGRRFGGFDHTTILHAVRKIEKLVKTDKQMEADIALLSELLKAFLP